MDETVLTIVVVLLAASQFAFAIYFVNWNRASNLNMISSEGDVFGTLVREFKLGSVRDIRMILRQSRACISGSTALYLLRPGGFYPNDIDFYVNPDGFPLLLKYMISHDYEVSAAIHGSRVRLTTTTILQPEEHDYSFHAEHIAVLLDMHHHSSPSLKINLIVSRTPHIVATITRFHSTLVMNYLAWYGLVSLYPWWTMQNVGLINRENVDVAIIEKYRGRGFTLYPSMDVVDDNHDNDTYGSARLRSLHDEAVFFLPFNDISTSLRALEPGVPWMLDGIPDVNEPIFDGRQTDS